jgi:ketosteroid isomerase-like protein
MSEGDLERVRAAFAAFNRDGAEGMLAYYHTDFEGVVPPDVSTEPDTYRGHDGIRRYWALWEEQIDDVRLDPEDVFEADGAIIVVVRMSGRGRGSGAPADIVANLRLTVCDGLFRTMGAYATVEGALAASGA